MSVVLAIKDGDRVIMAADSQFSRGGTKGTLFSPNLMKIWRPTGHEGVVMGVAGALRDQNILSTVDSWYDGLRDKAGEKLDFPFVVKELVPTIMNELTAHGRTTQPEGIMMMQSTILFAKDEDCYLIDADGCVAEFSYDGEAMAIGSGMDIALAAYNVLSDIKEISIEEKLIRAVSQACQDDLYVNYPIVIMSTDDDDIKVFDGAELYSINDELEVEVEEEVEEEIEE